jgi:anaerobic ribonucleoside-triphosphate reductase activating protein
MTAIHLSRIHFPVTTLGPGRRVAIWFQGCSIRCPGCVSVDTWDERAGATGISEVLDILALHAEEANGLTISGGEPLDQPDALAIILSHWRSLSLRSALLFTGYEMEDVRDWFAAHPSLVDAVIAGPFDPRAPQTLALRGSDNQRLHVLTTLGEEFAAYDRPADARDRRLDVAFDGDGHAWFAGIPARGDIGRLRRVLAAAGHRATLSDQTQESDSR